MLGLFCLIGPIGPLHAQSPGQGGGCATLLDRTMTGIDGKPRTLCQYAGHVVLVVNTASQCGYTPQYERLCASE